AQISGGPGISLVKTNRGALFLSASNIFDGPVEILSGQLTVGNAAALGTTNGNTVLRAGTLALHDVGIFGESLNVRGPGTMTMDNLSAAWNGSIVLLDDL